MSTTVESNVHEVIARLTRRARAIQSEYEATVTNNVEYAAAVNNGYTRTIVWSQLSRANIAAIILSMKKRKGQPRVWEGKGGEVQRGEGFVKIIVPPAGMVVKSIGPTKQIGRQILKALPEGFTDRHLQAAVKEIAFAAQSFLVSNTPVDQGVLIKGWEVK